MTKLITLFIVWGLAIIGFLISCLLLLAGISTFVFNPVLGSLLLAGGIVLLFTVNAVLTFADKGLDKIIEKQNTVGDEP